MKKLLIFLMAIILASPASARQLWHTNDGFSLTTVGWFNQDVFPDWTGIKVKLHVPSNGYVVLESQGSLEFHLPCKGWVRDVGIITTHGCNPDPQTGKDTLRAHQIAITSGDGCDEQGGDVLMVVRIPKIFTSSSCRPDSVRWAGGSYHVEE